MSAILSPERRDDIEAGCVAVTGRVRERIDWHESAVRDARARGQEDPPSDLPRVSSAYWVGWAAEILVEHGVPSWLRDADVRESFEDLAGPVLRRLRGFDEFRTWSAEVVEIRWSKKPIVVKDLVLTEAVAGRIKAVNEADRMTWSGEGPPPAFRVELSLPWWLLATEDEQERGLHAVLASAGMDDDKPCLRKPDILAFSSTLGRYGVAGVRAASAIAHAQAHPDHRRRMREYGFEVGTGQGLLWGPAADGTAGAAWSAVLADAPSALKSKRKPKAPKLVQVVDLDDTEN